MDYVLSGDLGWEFKTLESGSQGSFLHELVILYPVSPVNPINLPHL
jgi:hypothetical protein